MFKKLTYAEIGIDDEHNASILSTSTDAPRASLIANTHRTIIRVAELTKRDMWLREKNKWRLVQENFPLGRQLNETTHIFDGSLFTNNSGKRSFLMAALPLRVSESIFELSLEKWGSIHKIEGLETIEHMLFRHYAKQANSARDDNGKQIKNPKPMWVIFPQGKGFRLLVLDDGLPKSALCISSVPRTRLHELKRYWAGAETNNVTILFRKGEKKKNAWLQAFFKKKSGVEVVSECYSFGDKGLEITPHFV